MFVQLVDRIAVAVRGRDLAGGHGADRRAEEERHDTEESANVAPSTRASPIVAASPRTANAAPRKMIPTAAPNSGT